MQCPKCDNPLKQHLLKKQNIEVDLCTACKGIWFDDSELQLLLQDKAIANHQIPGDAEKQFDRPCPRCKVPLFEFYYPGTVTLVDVCKKCEGIWLDDKEWKQINISRALMEKITCPKCGAKQPDAQECSSCGIIFAKYAAKRSEIESDTTTRPPKSQRKSDLGTSYADDVPGLKGSLLRFIDRSIESLTNY